MGGSRRKSVTPQSPSRRAQAHRGSQTCIPDPKLAILGEVCNGQGAHSHLMASNSLTHLLQTSVWLQARGTATFCHWRPSLPTFYFSRQGCVAKLTIGRPL